MSLILSGTDGLSDVDGTAATPAIRGTDANTGIFFPAADTIAFSEGGVEAMRIDSSGNVGFGTATPANTRVTIERNAGNLRIRNTATRYRSDYGVNSSGVTEINSYDDTGGVYMPLLLDGNPLQFNISASEKMRIDSSGNLLVGTTSSSSGARLVATPANTTGSSTYQAFDCTNFIDSNFQINITGSASTDKRAVVGTTTNTVLAFQTNSVERARIDTSGNLLVGQTSVGIVNTNGYTLNTVLGVLSQNHDNTTTSGSNYTLFGHNGSIIGSITQSGTTAVLYNVTSDQRLKENIVDAAEFGSVIDLIKVRSFNWKTDQTNQRAGFIAQELVTVAPEAVHQPTNEEDMMAVDYSKLVPMLVKEIQSLRKRLAALESN